MHFHAQYTVFAFGLAALISAQVTSETIPPTFPGLSTTPQATTTRPLSTPTGATQSSGSRTGSLTSATGTASHSGSSLTGSLSSTGTHSGSGSSSHSSSGTLTSRPTTSAQSTTRALTTTSSSSSTSPTATDDSSISGGSSKGKKKKFGSGAGIIVGVLGFIGILAGLVGVWWKKRKSAKKGVSFNNLNTFLSSGGKNDHHEALPLTSNVGGPSPATHTPYSDAPHPPPPHPTGGVYAGDSRASLSNATLMAPQGTGSQYNMNDNPYNRSDASLNQSYPNPFETAAYNPSSGYSYPAQPGQHR